MICSLGHDFGNWFECFISTQEGRSKVLNTLKDELQKKQLTSKSSLKQTQPIQRNADRMLHMKDNNLISGKFYRNIRKEKEY